MAVGNLTEQNIQVARSLIRGSAALNIFGYQIAMTTSFTPAWEFATAYTYPVADITMTVTSAEAGDNGKTVLIRGLNSSYAEITDTVTLVGGGDTTTNVPFFRINDVILTSGITNAGLITVQNAAKTEKYGGIRAGDGRSQASIYTVPANKEFYLYRIDAFSNDSTAPKPAIFKNFVRNENGQEYHVARTTFYNNMNIKRDIPFRYAPKTDIQLQLRAQVGSHEIGVFAEGILVDLPRTMAV